MGDEMVQATPALLALKVPTPLGDICFELEYATVRDTLIVGQPRIEVHGNPGVDVVRLAEGPGISWRAVVDEAH